MDEKISAATDELERNIMRKKKKEILILQRQEERGVLYLAKRSPESTELSRTRSLHRLLGTSMSYFHSFESFKRDKHT